MSYHSHTLDVYGAQLYLATTPGQWRRIAKRLGGAVDKTPPQSAGGSTFGTWHPADRGQTVPHLILWVDRSQHATPAELVDTIAHEASHATAQLMEYVGHEARGVDEPSAYLVGWLARWMWERCEHRAH